MYGEGELGSGWRRGALIREGEKKMQGRMSDFCYIRTEHRTLYGCVGGEIKGGKKGKGCGELTVADEVDHQENRGSAEPKEVRRGNSKEPHPSR